MSIETVLVADDDRGVLDVLKKILERQGHHVLLASDGEETLRIAGNHSVDVALLDMKMPVIDGIEALKEIKKIDPQIEVLIMTAYANIETVRQSIMGHGAFDYIIKPFHKSEIVHTIGNALIKRRLTLQNRSLKAELEGRIAQLEEDFKERTRQLRESQIKYRDVLESANDMILVIRHGEIQFINETASELTGRISEEILGTPFLEMVHPDDRRMLQHKQERLSEGEDLDTVYPFRMTGTDGRWAWVELHAIRTTWNDRSAFIYILRDISERKRAEEALRASQEQFLTVMDSIDADISVTDLHTHEILWINRHMRDSFGENLIGTPCYRSFRNETGPCAECSCTELLNENGQPTGVKVWEGENPVTGRYYINHDRAIKWVDGRIVRLQVATDVTKLKLMEEELRKAQKLESVGVLAGGIAHDFNNILAIILGNISLAKIEAREEYRVYELLKEAEAALSRATALTQQLLTFSKGGAPVKRTASISELLEESTSFALRGSKVKCELKLADGLWPVEMDSGQINQVVHNLMINADQAMPEGGVVRLHAENCVIDKRDNLPLKPGRYVKISVHDQGMGIPKEHLGRIFDPYFTTKQRGSGLGLAVSYSIVKSHEGYLMLDSRLGAGTTFYIYLPASDREVASKPEGPEEIPIGAGKILLMDDEEMVRKVAGTMLSRLGYKVQFAKDGLEAIETYGRALEGNEPFDAVIMDLTVSGGMGGKEAMRRLIKIDPRIRAVVSSGYSNDPVMADFTRYHFQGVVSKPYKIEDLGRVLQQVIS